MTYERAAKRIRQACEPCRRKKSRCPGEKPTCSHCARLKQNCFFADEFETSNRRSIERVSMPGASTSVVPSSTPTIEDRLKFVEAKLAEVVSSPAFIGNGGSSRPEPSVSPSYQIPQSPAAIDYISAPFSSSLPSSEILTAIGETYLRYCDCQPIPLFRRENFMQGLHGREPELLFALLALAGRFLDPPMTRASANDFLEKSRRLVIGRISEGEVELSTLQTLCLLSMVDFTNGNTRRASLHSSMAISLAHNAGLTSESQQSFTAISREERRRCFWGLFLLKTLQGADFGILDLTGEETLPWYPESARTPNQITRNVGAADASSGNQDTGVVACSLQLSEIWFKITRYARRRGKPSKLPPWSPQSEYATIMAEQMESETRMPDVHRFKPAQFSKKSTEDLHANRDYWGPWIYLQILYHTNLCLLNHPLLLSLRLRNFKSPIIPEMFLQSTADLISSHTSWITHLIGMLEAKSFKVTDPFLGHCVAITATIYLQESFVEDTTIRKEKMDNFAKCLKFVRGFEEWPHVGRLADKLERLGETLTSAFGQAPDRNLLVDLGKFWEVLEYCTSSEVAGSARNIFGPSLHSGLLYSTTEMAHTSPLPPPTRVDTQDFASAPVEPIAQGAPFVYSEEELAVLEESFFQQRHDLEPVMNDWWGTGNL